MSLLLYGTVEPLPVSLVEPVDYLGGKLFIMSADADLVPVIQSIRKRFPEKRFVMVLPKVRFKRARDMKNAVHAAIPLTVGRLRKHQLTVF